MWHEEDLIMSEEMVGQLKNFKKGKDKGFAEGFEAGVVLSLNTIENSNILYAPDIVSLLAKEIIEKYQKALQSLK